MSDWVKTGDTEPVSLYVIDSSGDALTGLLDIYVRLMRASDGYFYDWNDARFKNTGWTTLNKILTEIDATNAPGLYEVGGGIVTTGFSGSYIFSPLQTPGSDAKLPAPAEMRVGGRIDKIYEIDTNVDAVDAKVDTAIADIAAIDGKVDVVDGKVDVVDGKVDVVDGKVDVVDGKVDVVDGKVDVVDGKVDVVDGVVDGIATDLTAIGTDVTRIEGFTTGEQHLTEGRAGNLKTYNAAGVLIGTQDVTGKDGEAIELQTGQPANRSKAV